MFGDPGNMVVRVILTKTDDSKKQQTVTATGRHSETFGGQVPMPRFGHYGFHYHAPAGSHGYMAMPGGNPDLAHALSFEHPDYRPTGTAEGETVMYAKFGQKIHCKADGTIVLSVSGGASIILKEDKVILVGKVKLGSEGANRPLSAQGTVDTGGFADTTNQLTKVWGE